MPPPGFSFLDYDGTLAPISSLPEMAKPSKRLLTQLRRLAGIPGNRVVIISGRQKEFLESWFGGLDLILVAEHGALTRDPGQDWVARIAPGEEWKTIVHAIMERYVKRCHGSFVEEKTASLVWHYRNSEPDFAFVRLQELKEELHEMLMDPEFPLQIVEGHKVLEVKRTGYDKGIAAFRILGELPDAEFLLAVGDDHTDEDLFRALPEDAVTIRVGAVNSAARYTFRKQTDVLSLLDKFADLDGRA